MSVKESNILQNQDGLGINEEDPAVRQGRRVGTPQYHGLRRQLLLPSVTLSRTSSRTLSTALL